MAGKTSGLLSTVRTEDGKLEFDIPKVEHPGTLESMIPVWGSGKEAIADFQEGDWVSGFGNTAMAVSDVFLAKAIAEAAAKGAFKLAPKAWNAARSQYLKQGFAIPNEPLHHWLVPQNGWGKVVPGEIKNMKWNLLPMDQADHVRLHGNVPGGVKPPLGERLLMGTPTRAKAGVANASGHTILGSEAQAKRH